MGCKKEEKVIAPTNLQLTTEISPDGSGKVNFTATATNADRYYFNFGQNSIGEGTRSTDGKASTTYTTSGTYTVKVTAYSPGNIAAVVTEQITVTVAQENEGFVLPDTYPGLTLAWKDEFNGTALNTANWTYEIGTGSNGWGNNELQYYPRKEAFGGRDYTSSRLKTQGKKFFKYGRIDIRAKLPEEQGILLLNF